PPALGSRPSACMAVATTGRPTGSMASHIGTPLSLPEVAERAARTGAGACHAGTAQGRGAPAGPALAPSPPSTVMGPPEARPGMSWRPDASRPTIVSDVGTEAGALPQPPGQGEWGAHAQGRGMPSADEPRSVAASSMV